MNKRTQVDLITGRFSVLPPWLDEEAVWGYYERVRCLNVCSASELRRKLASAANFRWGINILPKDANSSCPLRSTGFDVVRKHTAANVVLWNTSPRNFLLWSKVLRGDSPRPNNALDRYSTGPLYPRHCPICVSESLGSGDKGPPFWHRLHTLRFVAVCPQHGVPLLGGCGNCCLIDFRHGSNRMPSMHCTCGVPNRPVLESASANELLFLQRIAAVAEEMVAHEVPEVVVRWSRGTINRELARRSRGGTERVPDFLVQLVESGLLDLINREGIGSISQASMTAGVRGGGCRGLFDRVVLISELFGSIHSFVDACDKFCRDQPHPLEATILAHRENVLELLNGDEELSRSGLREFPSYRTLIRWDSEWLASRLPASRTGFNIIGWPGWESRDYHAMDTDTALRLIKERANFIRQALPPRRISYDALALSSLGLPHLRSTLPPQLESAVESVLESWGDYQRRWIRWAENHPEAFSSKRRWKKVIRERMLRIRP